MRSMRAAAVFLLVLAVLVTGNFAVSATYPPYRAYLHSLRSQVAPAAEAPVVAHAERHVSDAELAASVEKMAAGIDVLVASGSVIPANASGAFDTGTVRPPVSLSGAMATAAGQKEAASPEYPLSGVLLARLMPEIFPKKVENRGIFDIRIFRDINYTTYQDDKTKTKFYQFDETYGLMLSNLKLMSPTYAVKEADTFFDQTFFLNSTNKRDSTVRFVTELEGKAVGVETPKAFYPKLKKLLLQK